MALAPVRVQALRNEGSFLPGGRWQRPWGSCCRGAHYCPSACPCSSSGSPSCVLLSSARLLRVHRDGRRRGLAWITSQGIAGTSLALDAAAPWPHALYSTGDTGSDTPLTGRSSPRRGPPAAPQPPPLPPASPAQSARTPTSGTHARSAAARRVHSRRSFQRPRARRRPELRKLASLQPPGPELPPLALEQEETPL